MRSIVRTPMSLTHGTLPGAWVAACIVGKPFGTLTTDTLTGI